MFSQGCKAQVILPENVKGIDFVRFLLKKIYEELTTDQKAFGEGAISKVCCHLPSLVLFFRQVKFADLREQQQP